MRKLASIFAVVVTFGVGSLFWSGTSPADDARRGGRPIRGLEVVTGSYGCDGTVFTDDQQANVSAGAFLGATSGITDGYFGTRGNTREVPADLDAMEAICRRNVDAVVAWIPSICTLGPVSHERGEFGNGASVYSSFDFSCQGSRDAVVAVIGGFSRVALTTPLE